MKPAQILLLSCVWGYAYTSSIMADISPSPPPPQVEGWTHETVARGIHHPWGIAWLANGQALITSREGTLHLLDGESTYDVAMDDIPDLHVGGQGGLLDISIHPADEELPVRVYLTASTGHRQANRVSLFKGTYDGNTLHDIQELLRSEPAKRGNQHFGSRLLWLPDNTLLMTVGDGGNPPLEIDGMLAREQAQNKASHWGSVLRVTDEGKAPSDNPLQGQDNALAELWTWGHRNIQGLALDPQTGRVWANEHGPRGGDELNQIKKGQNYGWPLQTLGRDYRTGEEIGADALAEMAQPLVVWSPAHAPSGLLFYTGPHFPEWQGSLLSGGLAARDIRRVVLDEDGQVTTQERLRFPWRIREVSQGPDGHIYALTDEMDGRLIRIIPE